MADGRPERISGTRKTNRSERVQDCNFLLIPVGLEKTCHEGSCHEQPTLGPERKPQANREMIFKLVADLTGWLSACQLMFRVI